MKNELQAIATILSLINPAMCAAIFMQIETGRPDRARVIDATKAMLVVLTVLLIAAFVGAQVLNIFGVSLDAFSVAGGGVLVWIGVAMLTGRGTARVPDHNSQAAAAELSLVPLILFAASPGTITGVITISVSHSRLAIPVTAITAIVFVLAITWVLLVLTVRMQASEGGSSVVREMTTRYMGLIVIAMGIQFMLTGFKNFMGLG